ncbi:dynamin family protein [Tumebacillus algifaecis]|uniref:Dynamin family protein n=1 Tax=Tumebacillus algifaecis TaxID=1214604 RepID=A0A223CYP5_9BACL|nr:dynamin family protein [Tumebacillus algifaecis]ASS74276.1 dynamin family protein [Tumebacillus algifaecis]
MEDFKSQLGATANRLRSAADSIGAITGFKGMAAGMNQRAERLEQNLFTVALFGAFSAGKSSFANALMGEMVLPVSPNPTTAAINKILPPTSTYPHGAVRVKLKAEADITLDVQQSLAVFGLSAPSVEESLAVIATLDPSRVLPNAKPHFSFLKAVSKGLAALQEQLGQEVIVDLKEFKSFVAKEEKACFVEWIELYYDCPLTRQGITLVDTPGADSINARHTGVAFNYIKNADAVLFVTYYNHAFSNADREFLIQLGRVKDTFEMDKMFFVVNAADLAKDEEEMQGVVQHVRKNLVSCGISMPRIYPVSSQTALLARLHEKGELKGSAEKVYRQRTGSGEGELLSAQAALKLSGITEFEKDFLSFTISELTQIAVGSAEAEIGRALHALEELIASATEDESVRHEKLRAAEQAQAQAHLAIEALDASPEAKALQKEVDELIYYVRQRLFFRFGDLFKESFNPAVLQDDGRDLKAALKGSLDELARFIGYNLGQEMRATSLRLEKFINQNGKRIRDRLCQSVVDAGAKTSFEAYEARAFETLSFGDTMEQYDSAHFSKALGLFKSAKDFFEKNGRQAVQEALELAMQAPVGSYLEAAAVRYKGEYGAELNGVAGALQRETSQQVDEYFAGLFEALSAQVDVVQLSSARDHLQSLTQA